MKLHRLFLFRCQTSTRHISLRTLNRSAFVASAQTVRIVAGAAAARAAPCLLSGSLGETADVNLLAAADRTPGRNTCDPLLCDVVSHFTPGAAGRGCLPFESFVWCRGYRELATNTFLEHLEQVRRAEALWVWR